MSRQPTRRDFLRTSGAATLGFLGLRMLMDQPMLAAAPPRPSMGYGPLVPDPEALMDLPESFSYQVISRVGETMDDGLIVPAKHDGMAAFAGPDGLTVLVRNHEINLGASHGAFGKAHALLEQVDRELLYDRGVDRGPALGGTTTLVYDTRRQALMSHHLSLAGTLRNCAGGPTPWGSWLTCEETTARAGERWAQDHGYVFEVPARVEPGLAPPVPLKAMGRFNHEAVAVDPNSGAVYLTEDRGDGLLYRFLPNEPGEMSQGGQLQALALREMPSVDARRWNADQGAELSVDEPAAVRWIDLDDVEAPKDNLRHRGHNAGAARFARGEGMWFGRDAVYFACTNGGPAKKGQIWRYVPSAQEGTPGEADEPGELELFIEATGDSLLQNADNLTVAPWGDLVVCEDRGDAELVGVTPDGESYLLANNGKTNSEFAGVCFSPDGSTLFVNLQTKGMTLAITGPWRGTSR